MIFQKTIRNQKSCWYVDSQYGSKESASQHDLKTELGPVSDWIKHSHTQIKNQSSNPAKFAGLCWGKNRRPALRFHPKHSLSCLSSLKTKVWVLMWNEQEKKKATLIISAQRIFASPYKILSEVLWSQVIKTFWQQLNKFSSVSFALKQNTDFVSKLIFAWICMRQACVSNGYLEKESSTWIWLEILPAHVIFTKPRNIINPTQCYWVAASL